MSTIILDSNEYFYFDSSYRKFFLNEDSGGFVIQYDRPNLYDSDLYFFVPVDNYYIETSIQEEVIKVDYGEAAQKERWR